MSISARYTSSCKALHLPKDTPCWIIVTHCCKNIEKHIKDTSREKNHSLAYEWRIAANCEGREREKLTNRLLFIQPKKNMREKRAHRTDERINHDQYCHNYSLLEKIWRSLFARFGTERLWNDCHIERPALRSSNRMGLWKNAKERKPREVQPGTRVKY